MKYVEAIDLNETALTFLLSSTWHLEVSTFTKDLTVILDLQQI